MVINIIHQIIIVAKKNNTGVMKWKDVFKI